ncbi:hypothetical protein SASPL_114380 [Salvia splendens]|uniref:Uncharacterized protein n=1 Tax=Salvia splendens TaxID=180675 RepID=A0A8X9A150_SALSN|nr:hypothetical protein SASPL_114380 [Salvia splendens]
MESWTFEFVDETRWSSGYSAFEVADEMAKRTEAEAEELSEEFTECLKLKPSPSSSQVTVDEMRTGRCRSQLLVSRSKNLLAWHNVHL